MSLPRARRLDHALALLLSFPLGAGCSGGLLGMRSATPDTRPPDVSLVVIDSLRADHLSLYGHDQPTSPELDAWARDAVVFDHATTTAPWTLPAIASVLTGHHPYALGIREDENAVPHRVTTLGELYQRAGYQTTAVVSHIYLLPKFGLMQGMDQIDTELVKGHHERVSSDGVTDRALGALQAHVASHPEQPLFMVAHYFDPHYNYINHPEILDSGTDPGGGLHSNIWTSGRCA